MLSSFLTVLLELISTKTNISSAFIVFVSYDGFERVSGSVAVFGQRLVPRFMLGFDSSVLSVKQTYKQYLRY